MAWTEKLPSGKVRGCYRLADNRKRSKTFTTERAAARWASAQEQGVVEGSRRDPASARMRWATWVEQWWPSRQLSPNALRSQEALLRGYVGPRWNSVPLVDIEHMAVQTWVNGLTPGVSASTARQCFYMLSSSLKAAVRAGHLQASPCQAVVLPRLPPAPERYFTAGEIDRLFYQLDGCYRMLVELLLETGMRIGEAVALHQHRIDWAAGTIDVVEQWDDKTRQVKAHTKAWRRRTVPMSDRLAGVLVSWLEQRPRSGLCGFDHGPGSRCRSPLVIVGDHGAVLDPHNFTNRTFPAALDRAGLGHARPHDLRHSYASRLITNGISLERVQVLLGHESITTTARYAHLMTAGHDEVRAALAAAHGAGRGAGPSGIIRNPGADERSARAVSRPSGAGGTPQNPREAESSG